MGLFGRKEKAALEPLTPAEGLAGVAVCAIYSDGVINAEEEDRLLDALLAHPRFMDERESSVRETLAKLASLASRHGDGRVLSHAVEAIPGEEREDAFRLAAGIVAADHEIGDEEIAFLERFRVALGIDVMRARDIIDEMLA